MLPSNCILEHLLKNNLVWPELEAYIWRKPQSEQPRDQIELMLTIYESCENMSTPGTEANQNLFNAFYGTYDGNHGEIR